MVDRARTVEEEERQRLDALHLRAVEAKAHDVDAALGLARELVAGAAAIGYSHGHIRGLLLDAWIDELRGDMAASAAKVHDALEIAVASGDRHDLVPALISMGVAERWRNDYAAADDRLAEAIDIAHGIGDTYSEARALSIAADLAKLRSEYPQAMALYDRALDIARGCELPDIEAAVLSGLGNVYSHLGDYETAREHHERAVVLGERCGDMHLIAVVRFGLGTVQMRLGLYDQALEHYHGFLDHAQRVNSAMRCAYAMGNIAMIMHARGRTPTAIRYEHECLKWKEQVDDRAGIAISLNNLGSYHMEIGDYARAFQAFLQSLETCQGLGDREGEAVALEGIGTAYKVLGEHPRALDCFLRSLRIAQEVGNRSGETHALVHIAGYYDELRDHARAMMYYMRAMRIVEMTNEISVLVPILQRIATLYVTLGRMDLADTFLNRGLDIARGVGLRKAEIDLLLSVADLETRRSMPSAAVVCLETALDLADETLPESSRQEVLAALVRACEVAGQDDKRREYARSYSIGANSAFHATEAYRVRALIDRFEENAIVREGAVLGLDERDIEHIRELTRRRDGERVHEPAEVGAQPAAAEMGSRAATAPDAHRLRVVTFGALRVTVDGRALDKRDWGRKRARDLFKLLLVHHRSWLTIDEIHDRIWNDSTQRNAEALIRNAMSHLRKALSFNRRSEQGDHIRSGDGAYMLDLGAETWVDFLVFKELIVLARRSGNAMDRARHYAEAVGLYHGDFLLEDQFHEWSSYERGVLRDAYLEGLEFLGRERLRRGELDEAIETSRRILNEDGISDTAHEILMLALKRRGRIGEARQALEQCVRAYQVGLSSAPPRRLLTLLDD